jgi:hypothetical protein
MPARVPARVPALVLALVLALGVLAGCGDSRTAAPDLSTFQQPQGMTKTTYLAGGLRFDAPPNWATETGAAPMVVTLDSGPAIITIWRYPRSHSQVLPDNASTLQQARTALIGAASARDRTFRVISSAIIDLHGVPGVELDALETIRGQVRRVRSTHLYKDGAELVVDEYAPESLFHAVDAAVFSPLLHSVRLARVGSE